MFCLFAQQKGQGAPAREPVVSQEDQKAMMAYYYRKQEDMKVMLSTIVHTYDVS